MANDPVSKLSGEARESQIEHRLSPAVARLVESQQLDDRIRFVIKQLKLGEPPPQPKPGEPGHDPGQVADLTARNLAQPARGGRKSKFPKTKEEWAKKIAEWSAADPTGDRGSYLMWITKMVTNGSLTFPEDINKTKEVLGDYEKLKAKGGFKGDKNILSYKSFAGVFNVVQANAGLTTKGEQIRQLEMDGAEVVAEGDVQQVDRDDKGKIVRTTPLGRARVIKVDTSEAGARLFRKLGANWCVKDPQYFNCSSYAPPYFMVELKRPEDDDYRPKFLHDRKSMSLKRADDTDAKLNEIKPYAPLLKQCGLLDDKRGYEYMLGASNVRENRPLAFLSVLMSDDKDLIRRAHVHITKQLAGSPIAKRR